jgi:hypothetical protein
MRPTPEDVLDGAGRLLTGVLEEDALPADAAAAVTDAVRMIKQARRAVAGRPAFLAEDNDRMRALLAELVHDLPAGSPARGRVRSYLADRTAADPG